jgi:hypothetical protein
MAGPAGGPGAASIRPVAWHLIFWPWAGGALGGFRGLGS